MDRDHEWHRTFIELVRRVCSAYNDAKADSIVIGSVVGELHRHICEAATAPVTADTRRDQIIEAVAVHTPELINEGPNGEDDGQHLYCIECGVLPIDGLGLQYGPEHVADAVMPILHAAVREAQQRAQAAEAALQRVRELAEWGAGLPYRQVSTDQLRRALDDNQQEGV